MSDIATRLTCPACDFPVGARHECVRRTDDSRLLRSRTDVMISHCGAAYRITLTLDNTAADRLRARLEHWKATNTIRPEEWT
jgi:hemin uptake protein HemP